MLAFYANTDAELPSELAARVRAWIQGYVGSDSEPILRDIYARIRVSVTTIAGGERPEVGGQRSPRRLIAKRSAYAATDRAARHSTYGMERVAICGIATSVDGLVDAAIEARGVAQKAVEVAVREARSAHWSWAQISAALGGVPTEETLRRKFGSH